MRHFLRLLALIALAISAASCKGKTEGAEGYQTEQPEVQATSTPAPTKTPAPTLTQGPTVSPTPTLTPTPTPALAWSPFTGLPVEIGEDNMRPYAVMINNHNKALPQSGIAQADIIEEVLAEGDITRLLAIFTITDAKKIGPVRSARHYFVDMALDYDAAFIHHGGSEKGYDILNALRIDRLDGMTYGGVYLWRDPARVNVPGMYEHSSYTDALNLSKAMDYLKYRKTLSDTYKLGFGFLENPGRIAQSLAATKITVPYTQHVSSEFTYDVTTNKYYKTTGGKSHIDDQTGEQLAFENVIIQYATISLIPNDDAGRRDVKLVGQGSGLLATGGGYVPIKWSKASHRDPTVWQFESGADMLVNKGKTFIAILSDRTSVVIN